MTELSNFILKNTSWFNKMIKNHPKTKNTNEFISKNLTDTKTVTFKVNKSIIIKILAVDIFLLISSSLLIEKCFANLVLKNILGLIISLFLFSLVTIQCITHLKNIFKIEINNKSILINKKNYFWNDIKDTYLMYEHQNRRTILHLVIETNNNKFEKFNLINFNLNDEYFSKYIEYLKSN